MKCKIAVKFFYNANTILKCLEFCEFNNCKKKHPVSGG